MCESCLLAGEEVNIYDRVESAEEVESTERASILLMLKNATTTALPAATSHGLGSSTKNGGGSERVSHVASSVHHHNQVRALDLGSCSSQATRARIRYDMVHRECFRGDGVNARKLAGLNLNRCKPCSPLSADKLAHCACSLAIRRSQGGWLKPMPLPAHVLDTVSGGQVM